MKKKSAASTSKAPLGEAIAVLVERFKKDGYTKDTIDQYASIVDWSRSAMSPPHTEPAP